MKSMVTCRHNRQTASIAHQIWRTMKLTVILTIIMLQVSARGLTQNISFSGTNVPLTQVFSAIKKQTDYVIFYRTDDLSKAKPVTIDLKQVPLEEALNRIFRDQP